MTDRATCWSITINNPQESEYRIPLPVGWKLEGQIERGESGTEHYQGCLRTPQVRFSAVKKQFPRAHIEIARDPQALRKYVHKEETRVREVDAVPTMFQYQDIIAGMWIEDEFRKLLAEEFEKNDLPDCDEVAMRYLDSLVARDIEAGRRGAEFIAINPMWRSSWKRFYRSIIKRNAKKSNEEVSSPSPAQADAETQSVSASSVA